MQRKKFMAIDQYSQLAFATGLAIVFMGVMMYTLGSYVENVIELEAATHLLTGE